MWFVADWPLGHFALVLEVFPYLLIDIEAKLFSRM